MGNQIIKNYFKELTDPVCQIPVSNVERVVQIIYDAYCNGKQVFLM